jgi:hypothetical protein
VSIPPVTGLRVVLSKTGDDLIAAFLLIIIIIIVSTAAALALAVAVIFNSLTTMLDCARLLTSAALDLIVVVFLIIVFLKDSRTIWYIVGSSDVEGTKSDSEDMTPCADLRKHVLMSHCPMHLYLSCWRESNEVGVESLVSSSSGLPDFVKDRYLQVHPVPSHIAQTDSPLPKLFCQVQKVT